MTMWDMYWLVKLDDIKGLFVFMAILSGIAFAAVCIMYAVNYYADDDDDSTKLLQRWITRTLVTVAMFALLSTVTPSTKQMAVIIVTPKICNAINSNEQLKKIPDKIVDLAGAWITGLKPKPEQPKK